MEDVDSEANKRVSADVGRERRDRNYETIELFGTINH